MRLNARARKPLPVIAAHPLERRRAPFDDPDWLFELKADGFRGLLYIAQETGRLVSRNGRELRRFRPLAETLARRLKVQTAILDGEVVVKDASGRDIFLDLVRRHGEPNYVAFDLLWLNGRDLRRRPLIERKGALRKVLPRRSRFIRESLCVSERGRKLFALVQRHDLEGIVAKRKADAYTPSAKWLKIKNPRYSQAEGRGELFNPPQR